MASAQEDPLSDFRDSSIDDKPTLLILRDTILELNRGGQQITVAAILRTIREGGGNLWRYDDNDFRRDITILGAHWFVTLGRETSSLVVIPRDGRNEHIYDLVA